MAVFVAAADESDGPLQTGPFAYGGFVAPSRDWIDWFAPAWEERVLNVDPPIPFFHMAEIRNPKWQIKNGLTAIAAERRIDEAVRVIASMGSLHLVLTSFDGGHFRKAFQSARVNREGPQSGTYPFDPDYVGFSGFSRGVLEYVHQNFPDAERVDFVVEKKQRVSHHLPNYLGYLERWLRENGQQELLPLIGELTFGEKTRVPLQAADLAMWHIRRQEAQESDANDKRRLKQMFHGRTMTVSGMTNDVLSDAAEG